MTSLWLDRAKPIISDPLPDSPVDDVVDTAGSPWLEVATVALLAAASRATLAATAGRLAIAICVMGVVALPNLAWERDHGWVSVLFQLHHGLALRASQLQDVAGEARHLRGQGRCEV